MIQASVKVPLPFEYAFPHGALGLGVDKQVDFDRRREEDNQARDAHGVRLWVVKVMDLDPEAGKFGRSTEVRVKVAAAHQPVLPASRIAGYPPSVEFTDMVATPYADSRNCKGHTKPGEAYKCRARLGWSLLASGVVAAGEAGTAAEAVA